MKEDGSISLGYTKEDSMMSLNGRSKPEMRKEKSYTVRTIATKESSGEESFGIPCFGDRIFLLKFLLVGSLLVTVGLCSTLAYIKLSGAELALAQTTYESIATSALENARAITQRKLQGSEVMATMMSQIFPNSEDWPYIELDGYIPIATKVAQLSSSYTQALMVLITVDQAQKFENHTKQIYADQGRPETAGVSDFGFGIWKPDPSKEYEDGRQQDLDGVTEWGGEWDKMAVLTMHNKPGASSLLYNVYSEQDRGSYLDSMVDCINNNPDKSVSPSCPSITDMLTLKVRPGPAGLLFQPIYPANSPSEFVGFATTSIHWQEVLENIVPDYVSGLTCVVTTATSAYTYAIKNGIPELKGDGDMHDTRYTSYGRSATLNEIQTNTTESAVYTLTVYPTEENFATYSSNSPLAIALGFFGAIAFCTFIFFMYDYLMMRDVQQREAVLEMKRRFVRYISHEIRTPLNTVCMGLELLDSELKETDNTKTAMEDMKQNVEFWTNVVADVNENAHVAVAILNDLLNYDKLETGSLKLETGIVFIWDLLSRTVNQFQIQAVNRKVNLNLNLGKSNFWDMENGFDPCNVIGDDVRLGQVFRNVISNALKFTPPDGNIDITAEYVANGLPGAMPVEKEAVEMCADHERVGSIRMSFKDSGVGLSEEQLERLFAEGVQFDANRLQHGGGSGLGLNIAKGLVEQHGGTIHAESEGFGYGTTFVVELPLYNFTKEELIEEINKKDDGPDLFNSKSQLVFDDIKKKRILVAEDVASSRKMLMRLLERSGHTCVPACNGQEAVDIIKEDMRKAKADPEHEPINTVMMDYEMPMLNGPQATRRLRQIGYKMTVIGVTGNVLEEDVEFFKNQGANEVFSKPVSMDVFNAYWCGYRDLDPLDISNKIVIN